LVIVGSSVCAVGLAIKTCRRSMMTTVGRARGSRCGGTAVAPMCPIL
jgi:hypothetical protein